MDPVDTYAPEAPKKSRRLLWAAIAGVVTVIVVAVIVAALVMNGSKKEEVLTASPSPTPEATVASNEDVKQNLAVLDATIKQASEDQTAAKSALKDGTNQIKVAN